MGSGKSTRWMHKIDPLQNPLLIKLESYLNKGFTEKSSQNGYHTVSTQIAGVKH